MPRNVIIKFEDKSEREYTKVPDNVSIDEVKKKAAQEFPNKKITGTSEEVYRPDPKKLSPGEKPMVDIEKSSEKPAGETPAADDASSDESKKDYRADFPNLYTPKGYIRNKRGDLIYY